MQTKIFFRAASGNDYELTVLHDDDQYVPKFISEDSDAEGRIYDLSTERNWESLPAMTQELEIEIIGCDSDVGD